MNEKLPLQVYEDALHDLNSVKDREADYAQINALQSSINRFAELIRLTDALAGQVAKSKRKSKQKIIEEYLKKDE